MDVDVLGGTRMSIPRLVLRVLSPSPCMAVDTRIVPSLMDAVERDRDRGGAIKLLLDMESLGSHCSSLPLGTDRT